MGPAGKTSRNRQGTFSFFKGLPARENVTGKGVEGRGTGAELSEIAAWDPGSVMGGMAGTEPVFSELGDPTSLSGDAC